MGFNTYVYVGAYLEVKGGTKENKKEVFFHHETGKQVSSRFDPETGTPNVVREEVETTKVYPNCWDINDGEFEDDFMTPEFSGAKKGYTLFIPNHNGKFCLGKIDCDYSDGESVDLSKANSEEVKQQLIEKYDKCIKALEKEYEDVQIKFGVVSYAM